MVGLGKHRRVAVREVDVRRDASPDRNLVAAQLERLLHLAYNAGHDRPDPKRLLDHRIEVLAVSAVLDLGP